MVTLWWLLCWIDSATLVPWHLNATRFLSWHKAPIWLCCQKPLNSSSSQKQSPQQSWFKATLTTLHLFVFFMVNRPYLLDDVGHRMKLNRRIARCFYEIWAVHIKIILFLIESFLNQHQKYDQNWQDWKVQPQIGKPYTTLPLLTSLCMSCERPAVFIVISWAVQEQVFHGTL